MDNLFLNKFVIVAGTLDAITHANIQSSLSWPILSVFSDKLISVLNNSDSLINQHFFAICKFFLDLPSSSPADSISQKRLLKEIKQNHSRAFAAHSPFTSSSPFSSSSSSFLQDFEQFLNSDGSSFNETVAESISLNFPFLSTKQKESFLSLVLNHTPNENTILAFQSTAVIQYMYLLPFEKFIIPTFTSLLNNIETPGDLQLITCDLLSKMYDVGLMEIKNIKDTEERRRKRFEFGEKFGSIYLPIFRALIPLLECDYFDIVCHVLEWSK